MKELKTLDLDGELFDSFPDKTAREGLANKIMMPTEPAHVGQLLRVAAIDEDGRITAVTLAEAAEVDGASAYELAVSNGFEGSEAEWLASLEGASAYDVASANGFEGSEAEWLASLEGHTPEKGIDYFTEEELQGVAEQAARIVDEALLSIIGSGEV